MKKVIGIGNALVDIMTKIEDDSFLNEFSLPKGSMQLIDEYVRLKILDKTEGFNVQQTSGGCASNTVHGLAHLGVETGFMGKVGNDELGRFFQEDMKGAGISPYVSISNNNTGTAIALVSPDSERTFATYLGAAVELTPGELSEEIFRDYDVFHIEGYLLQNHDLILKAVRIAKEYGMKVSIDLASYNVVEANLEFLESIVKLYVDIVFANEEEAKAFTGKGPEEALHIIAQICEIAVVKLGKKGSMVQKGESIYKIEPIEANSIDTTGAGDLYAAGFLYGMINDISLEKCGMIGSLLAGKVIEVIGAKIPEQTWDEIKDEIRRIM